MRRPQGTKRAAIAFACLAACLNAAAYGDGPTRRALLIGINHYAPPSGDRPYVPQGPHARDSRFDPGTSWSNLNGSLNDVRRMQFLLREVFGFQDIRTLDEREATRSGILAAIEQLAADTRPGDIDVIYYAGHGSRRKDTLSSKTRCDRSADYCDETIVPIDAWRGAEDIRDKELALRFNAIVYDRHAHLTAIFDSCHSGEMARGVSQSVPRSLPYDDRDVAEEKRHDPATVVEGDLERLPQQGDAIIVAAALDRQEAVEVSVNGMPWSGIFTRDLAQVLQANTQPQSARDVIAQVSALMHQDPRVVQQPSAEGRTEESLFGDPVAAHTLHVHVTQVAPEGVTLDLGRAAGFDVGTQFRAVEAPADGRRTTIEVVRVDEQLVSTAKVISGPKEVAVGQTFELAKMLYPAAARLAVFASRPDADPWTAAASARESFPQLTWIADPTDAPIDYLVVDEEARGWVAYDRHGRAVGPGPAGSGIAFLLAGPPARLRAAIESGAAEGRGAFTFTATLSNADYLLAARRRSDGVAEYALVDPKVLAAHSPDAWVRSSEEDDKDAALTGSAPAEVVCRNDNSFPVRTAWLPYDEPDAGAALVQALTRRLVRLGKLHAWLRTPSRAPGVPHWPYGLEITGPDGAAPLEGILHRRQQYTVRLVTTADRLARDPPVPRYAYLVGFDCAGNARVLYPGGPFNGESTLPERGSDGRFPLSVPLPLALPPEEPGLLVQPPRVDEPLGADTLFLLLTATKLIDPDTLVADGLFSRSRAASGPADAILGERSETATRGSPPANWLVQYLVIPSRP